MAFVEGVNTGTSNSTTNVTVVAAPGASETRVIKSISVYNADTVQATVTLKYYDGTNERIMCKIPLETGETLLYDSILVLNTTSTIIRLVLAGAITTNQLHFTAHYGTAS